MIGHDPVREDRAGGKTWNANNYLEGGHGGLYREVADVARQKGLTVLQQNVLLLLIRHSGTWIWPAAYNLHAGPFNALVRRGLAERVVSTGRHRYEYCYVPYAGRTKSVPPARRTFSCLQCRHCDINVEWNSYDCDGPVADCDKGRWDTSQMASDDAKSVLRKNHRRAIICPFYEEEMIL